MRLGRMIGQLDHMKPDDVKRVLYGLMMVLVGLLGLAIIVFFFLVMAGMTTVVSWFYAVLWFGTALSGPLMLLTGGALFALNLKPRVAACVAFSGAIVVTLWTAGIIGSAVVDAAHPSANPAIDSTIHSRDAVIYGILAAATGMVDWAGYRALRLARWRVSGAAPAASHVSAGE
jgi:hypothetical protein